MLSRSVALRLVLALSGVSRALLAATPAGALQLSWEAPAECPEQAQVERQVEALLGNADQVRRELEARAQVTRAADGSFRMSLTLLAEGAVDQRELVGDSCQALADSLAVMLALQLNPTGEVEKPPPPKPKPQQVPPPAARTAPKPPPARASSRFWQLALSGSGDSAALPRFALGGRLELGFTSSRWYVGAGASLWLPEQLSVAEGHAGQARFGWRALSLAGCHASFGQAMRVGPCVSLELGQLTARSLEVRAPGEVTELWLAGLGGLSFWVPLSPSWLFTSGLALSVPLTRPSFVIEGIGQIHRPRALGARSALGLAARF